jgi:hypothetical protein
MHLQQLAPWTAYHASAACFRHNLNLSADALLDGRHVRYDPDQLAVLLQAREGFQGGVERR